MAAPLIDTNTGQKPLSPQARKLLAELSGDGALSASLLTAPGGAAYDGDAPVLLTPHEDKKASAFADLLDHIDDGDGSILVDEKAALAVAEKYNTEKLAANSAFDEDDLLDAFAPDNDGDPQAIIDDDLGGASTLTDAEIDEVLGEDPFGELDGAGDDEKQGRFAGLMNRFRAGAGGVKRIIGVRNAAAAYDAQSGTSLLPFTVIRAVILILVAAVPPVVNLTFIQPQISDNSRKLTQIRGFEAQMAENKKVADKVAKRLSALEQDAKRRIDRLMPSAGLETLFNSYISALQKYDIELQGYNVSPLTDRKVIIGRRVQEANLVELDLVGRYDVYVDIRKIFVDQLKIATVVTETMTPKEGSPELQIKASMMVPTKRDYDNELDDPAKQVEAEK